MIFRKNNIGAWHHININPKKSRIKKHYLTTVFSMIFKRKRIRSSLSTVDKRSTKRDILTAHDEHSWLTDASPQLANKLANYSFILTQRFMKEHLPSGVLSLGEPI